MLIYLALNRVNNKVYVGQHQGTDASYRWNQHTRLALSGDTSCPYLYAAIRRYGPNSFSIHLLSSFASSREDLNAQEIQYIAQHRATEPNFGYNCAIGGQNGGMKGKHQSDYQKKRAGDSSRNRVWSLTSRQKASISALAKPVASPALCQKRSKFMQGNTNVKGLTWKSEKGSKRCSNSRWVNNGLDSRFVEVKNLPAFLSSGWQLGRIICKRRTKTEMRASTN